MWTIKCRALFCGLFVDPEEGRADKSVDGGFGTVETRHGSRRSAGKRPLPIGKKIFRKHGGGPHGAQNIGRDTGLDDCFLADLTGRTSMAEMTGNTNGEKLDLMVVDKKESLTRATEEPAV